VDVKGMGTIATRVPEEEAGDLMWSVLASLFGVSILVVSILVEIIGGRATVKAYGDIEAAAIGNTFLRECAINFMIIAFRIFSSCLRVLTFNHL
jgi:large-conductance mechanosensitive channel